ncbi:MAG: class I SAM-dependent methyltransferase, partial [Thermoanaerobaculia bacterium]|nr:class I SAM-dependent methyltransferase [Thermoanaerobaculia bacterium]
MKLTIEAAERGWLPPSVLRWGIRRRVAGRLAEEIASGNGGRRVDRAAAELKRGPFATHQSRANEQHYELPPEFFRLVLGEHLKYSCGLWENAGADLDAAEAAMLELTCRRAGIEDGMRVLDLGCGWGSLSLWLAERYPRARVVALSNSRSQREYIEAEAARRGLRGLRCLTADVTTFDAEGS